MQVATLDEALGLTRLEARAPYARHVSPGPAQLIHLPGIHRHVCASARCVRLARRRC